ncbi:arginase family protein [Micromonospora coxensis]|uniref:Arginase n=1 Tax=Micromonospora coxensis TaxID=356852 RepID=A0A1C5JQI0_9ACTN|nr:arginase family protein [Micromonospora coxensis]SCG72743.1 arginase [Micromonospora coxensis]
MRLTVLEVPQWQGSSSRTAHRLRRGSAALARMLPADERVVAAVDQRPGRPSGGVAALDVLADNLAACRAALARVAGGLVVTVGGDCGVELAPVEAALAGHGDDLALVWFDAHADLNTATSSPSHAFHGMVLRALLGEGPAALTPARTLSAARLVLAGVRALDPGERAYVRDNAVTLLDAGRLAEPAELVAAVAATGARTVYVHIDLDVLDPGEFAAVGCPEPGGLTPQRLVAAVAALAGRFRLAGVGMTEYEPDHPHDEEVLARLAAALGPVLCAGPDEAD